MWVIEILFSIINNLSKNIIDLFLAWLFGLTQNLLTNHFENFDILIELDLCFENHQADSVFFEFYVASPNAINCRPINCFSPPTLVLEEFDWNVIKRIKMIV